MANKLNVTTIAELADRIKRNDIDLVDACFCDPLGCWHHCTFAPSQCTETDLVRGFAFDGSSIRLFSKIDASDMVMKPVPTTCWIDPFHEPKVLHVTCVVTDPNGHSFSRCPRTIASNAIEFMRSAGIADEAFIGPEAEFFVFDEVRFSCSPNKMSFEIDQCEAYWNSDRETFADGKKNLGHRCEAKKYYFPTGPLDSMCDLRSDMLLTMQKIGVPIEKHHHEVACCQHELGFVCKPLVECADLMMCYKYVIKNTARKHNKTATFMPKPFFGDNGSGMHCHQSLWKGGQNLFFDNTSNSYMNLSGLAMQYMAGLLAHSHAVLAFTNCTVNSYKRLVPGYEAPVNLVYSKGNRSAAIRIPLCDADNPATKRLEFRCPDPAACSYLAFAVMLMAGIDGIQKKMIPPPPMDRDLFELTPEERCKVPCTPSSLAEALDALEKDHEFLLKGGVFTEDFIKAYIALKREEVDTCRLVPHPKEYQLYYHC